MVYRMIVDTDISIELLDARFPEMTRCKNIEKFVRTKKKPLLFCINKCDLVPKKILENWKSVLSKVAPTVFVSTRERLGTSLIRKEILKAVDYYTDDDIRACLFGVPNTGKSSLINVLAGRSSAPVSPKPGKTRALQYIRISPKLFLVDTPGVSPLDSYSIEEKTFMGAISPEKVPDPDIIAEYFIERIITNNRSALRDYLGFDHKSLTADEILEKLAIERNRLKKGGIPDVITISKMFMTDFLKGKILYYETPEQR
ncbi:MAG: GTPase [Candidatus Hodarchaeales archaeon]